MPRKPYASPLGVGTKIGRAQLELFSNECPGTRMLYGEVAFRMGRVTDTSIENGFATGITVKAQVRTAYPLQCKIPSGRYSVSIKVSPFTAEQQRQAIETLKASELWYDLLNDRPYSSDTPVLDLPEFAAAPRLLLEKLVNYRSSCITADCNCSDFVAPEMGSGWCKHVASMCYVLINTCETDPMIFLHSMGLDIPYLLNEGRAVSWIEEYEPDQQMGVLTYSYHLQAQAGVEP